MRHAQDRPSPDQKERAPPGRALFFYAASGGEAVDEISSSKCLEASAAGTASTLDVIAASQSARAPCPNLISGRALLSQQWRTAAQLRDRTRVARAIHCHVRIRATLFLIEACAAVTRRSRSSCAKRGFARTGGRNAMRP